MQSAKSAKKNRFTTRHSNETISAHDRRDYDSELASRKLARMIVLSDPKRNESVPKGKTYKQIKREWRELIRKERAKKEAKMKSMDIDIVQHIAR